MNTTTRNVLLGFAALIGMNVAAAIVLGLLAGARIEAAFVPLFAIGLVQLLWAVPGAIWAYRSGRKSFGHGVVLGAALVLLVNGGCFVYVMASMGSFH